MQRCQGWQARQVIVLHCVCRSAPKQSMLLTEPTTGGRTWMMARSSCRSSTRAFGVLAGSSAPACELWG